MAWVKKLPSGKYSGRYRDKFGKERTAPGGPFAHKRAALAAGTNAETLARRSSLDPDAGARPFDEWAEEWMRSRTVDAGTLERDRGLLRIHVLPHWSRVKLADITRLDVQTWVASMRGKEAELGPMKHRRTVNLSDGTVRKALTVLSGALKAAVDSHLIADNPAAGVRVSKGSATPDRYLTRDEFEAARQHLSPAWQRLALLLVNTGMRIGEAQELRWKDVVDIGGGERAVHVRRQLRPDGTPVEYTKGKKPRLVPVPAAVLAVFEKGDPEELVVRGPRGGTVDRKVFYRAWVRACDDAGLGRVRVHDIRHTYASWLLQAGVPLAEVARLLGNTQQAAERYARLASLPTAAVLAALRGPQIGSQEVPQDGTQD